jgi:hypothetical protein
MKQQNNDPRSNDEQKAEAQKCMCNDVMEVVVEERTLLSSTKNMGTTTSTFESCQIGIDGVCPCYLNHTDGDSNKNSCTCFVAQLTLLNSCVQSINKPTRRHVESWDLVSPNHTTDFVMQKNSLVLKANECLWDWRTNILPIKVTNHDIQADVPKKNDTESRVVVIKFMSYYRKQFETKEKKMKIETLPLCKVDSLPNLLTIIVTTSPIKSNPSTELLEKIFCTFPLAGYDFAYKCQKIIICDGVRIQQNKEEVCSISGNNKPTVTRKHSNVKQALRNGIATTDQAKNYENFKLRIRKLCEDANAVSNSDSSSAPSLFCNTRVVELDERHGYGFALRHAVSHEVKTPYVCVIQHDRTFMRNTPIEAVVKTMAADSSRSIKYVGMSMRSNLTYRDIFLTKYGRSLYNDLCDMVLLQPTLALDASMYGPQDVCMNLTYTTPALKDNLVSLANTYKGTMQSLSHLDQMKGRDLEVGKHQLSLTPTLFWYDNVHCCETAHYRDFILNTKYKMVARGGFVEDKLSPAIIRSVERFGLREGHSKFGCYLLDDHSGFFFTGHLDGGSFISEAEKQHYEDAGYLKSNSQHHQANT